MLAAAAIDAGELAAPNRFSAMPFGFSDGLAFNWKRTPRFAFSSVVRRMSTWFTSIVLSPPYFTV